VARSVRAQRDKVRILPVPTRIERSEKDKLDLRRSLAMQRFGELLDLAGEGEREAYWTDVELLYEPYYAYEEILATFRDRPGERHTILASVERLTTRIAGADMRAVRISEPRRQSVLAEYAGVPPRIGQLPERARGAVFISYRRSDSGYAGRIYDRCAASLGAGEVFMDVDIVQPGDDFVSAVERAVGAANVMLVVIGPRTRFGVDPDDLVDREVATAIRLEKRVIPVLVGGAQMPAASTLPPKLQPLAQRQALALRDAHWNDDMDRLLAAIELAAVQPQPAETEPVIRLPPPRYSAKSDEVIETVLRGQSRSRVNSTVTVVAIVIAVLALLVLVIAV
jgi:hypothetical protein